MPYRVTCALLIIKDQEGRNHHTYHGGVTHYLNDEQREHFLRLGLVEEFGHEEAESAAVESVSHSDKPARTAPHKAWVDFAVSKGLSRPEHESKSKQELIDLLG